MNLKAFTILGIILVSVAPVYILYRYLLNFIRPRESPGRFIICLLSVLLLIFAYTFLLVFLIHMLFPGA